jgi:Cu/Ag efflux protein CusF
MVVPPSFVIAPGSGAMPAGLKAGTVGRVAHYDFRPIRRTERAWYLPPEQRHRAARGCHTPEQEDPMRTVVAVFIGSIVMATSALLWAQTPGAPGEKKAPMTEKKPAVGEAAVVKVHGTIDAIDKENRTITLKGPKGRTVTLDVKDPSKLDAVKVGDPVVAAYVEAVAIEVKKAGSATPGITTQESRVSSKPGETPAGAIGREVTVTGTITGVDRKAQTVTIKGPRGNEETVKVKNPKNLEGVKAGDMVELTFAQALAVSLDKAPPAKDKPATK